MATATADRLDRLDDEIARRLQHEETVEAVARDLAVPVGYAAAIAEFLLPQGEDDHEHVLA